MNPHVTAFFEKAHRALATARTVAGAGDAAGAVNRAYYAAFYAASAALLSLGEAVKTHTGVHNQFRIHFVRTGKISEEVGRALPVAFHLRQQADYDAMAVFEVDVAFKLISDVERFVEAVDYMIEGHSSAQVS